MPAYLNLGDVRERQGNLAGAVEAWETLVQRSRPSARIWRSIGSSAPIGRIGAPQRFVELCQRLIAATPGLARAPGAVASSRRRLDSTGRRSSCCSRRSHTTRTASPFTRRSGRRCQRSASIPAWSARYIDLTRDAVFYLDPHVCLRCRYRSTELLWQCPQCHEWNTFVEERIAPAKDATVAELSES